jgi:hypothetical protein
MKVLLWGLRTENVPTCTSNLLPSQLILFLTDLFLISPQVHTAVPIVPRVIASSVEHPAILAYLRHLQSVGSIVLDIVGVTAEVTTGRFEQNTILPLLFYLYL